MGISGLLPLLKSIQKPCSLKNFKGQTIGVDAYGWLHRGTVACAIELALDKPTLKYAEFAISRVKMLQAFGITPYLVFDGDALPSKAGTNAERRRRRHESKALGLQLYKAGKISQAHQEFQKAAEVTYQMAGQLIEDLKRLDIQYVVAPYEADAQLVYLEQRGIIDGILSEDSDMLVYGAKRLITKLDQYGACVMIDRADFALCKEVSLAGWSDAMFRCMAILSGCDYLPSINKMGLKTAYRFVRKHREAQKTIRMIALEAKLNVPVDYLERFQQAELTFLHHRVFCPLRQEMVHMSELPRGLKAEDMPYLGPYVEPDIMIGVACGDLNPRTKEPLFPKAGPLAPKDTRLQAVTKTTPSADKNVKSSQSIDSFFAPKRRPLAELDPNSLTPSPSQQRLLERHRNSSWTPREVSSAPPLRRAATSPPLALAPLAVDRVTDRSSFLARAAKVSGYQAPKRQRLCSDPREASLAKEEGEQQPQQQSHFFVSTTPPQPSPLVAKKMRNKKARVAEFDIFSDDSVDDILLGLPDPPCTSEEDSGERTPSIDRVPQSPAAGRKSIEIDRSTPLLHKDDARATEQVVEVEHSDPESFEDILESHIQRQKTGHHLTCFAYQSPSTERRSQTTTFIAQSPTKQRMALASLPRSGTVGDICESVMLQSSKLAADTGGSEDALVPASDDDDDDDDDDDEVSDVDSPGRWRRALNLTRFVYGSGVNQTQS